MPAIRNLIELSSLSSNTTYSSSSSSSKILGVVNNARYEGDDDNTATRIKELNDTKHDGGILYIDGYAYKIEVVTPVKKNAVTLSFENGSSRNLYGDGGETEIAFIKAIPINGGPVRYFAALDDSVGSLPPIKSISTSQLDFDPAGHDVKINLNTSSNVITVVPDVTLANDSFRVAENDVLTANVLANDKGSNLSVTAISANGTSKAVGSTFTVTTAGGHQATVQLNANGTLTVDPSDELAKALKLGQTDSLSLTYTAGGKTATVNIAIDGRNGIYAADDHISLTEGAAGRVFLLANDAADSGRLGMDSISYNGVKYSVGQSFIITAANGVKAELTVLANGLAIATAGGDLGDIPGGAVINFTGLSYTIVDLTDPTLKDTASLAVTVTGVDNFAVIDDRLTSSDEFVNIVHNVLDNDTPAGGTLTISGFSQNGVAFTVGHSVTLTTEGGHTVNGTLLENGNFIIFGNTGTIANLSAGQTDRLVATYEASFTGANGTVQTGTANVEVVFTGTDPVRNLAPVAVANTLATLSPIQIGIEQRVDITDKLLANDYDPEGDAFVFHSISTSNSPLQVELINNRVWVSTLGDAYDHLDNTDYVENAQFSYALIDSHGNVSNTAVVDVYIYDL